MPPTYFSFMAVIVFRILHLKICKNREKMCALLCNSILATATGKDVKFGAVHRGGEWLNIFRGVAKSFP